MRTTIVSSRNFALSAALICGVLFGATASAQAIVQQTQRAYKAFTPDRRIRAALLQLEKEDARTFAEQIEISEIPAPGTKEAVRAADYIKRLQALGLNDAATDATGNVIARRKGTGKGPTLVLSAHLDTVFPEGTDVKVRERDGRFYGPGLADDSRGLTVLLSVLRALQDNDIKTRGDLLFVATVGEEGLGNLRGVKGLMSGGHRIDGFISVDSVDAPVGQGEQNIIVDQATGSRRWSFQFKGPGGHSFDDFGRPSAVHAMGRAIATISDLRPPADPKTTFTVGIVSGGTAINAIAAEAEMRVDIRGNRVEELQALEKSILAAADAAVVAENAHASATSVRVEKQLLGDRPAGASLKDSPVVHAMLQGAATLKLPKQSLVAGSTDANVPLGLGVPAATVSGGGEADNAHSLDEWYRPVQAWLGPQNLLLATLALVGVDGLSPATLPVCGGCDAGR